MNFKGASSLKNQFPFRLGTTSYIIPADILANVRFLADRVDDIELVLFESDEVSNLPDAATVRKLRETADTCDLTYTVHLPLDTWMGHPEKAVRERSVDKCLRVMERTSELIPFAYVLHFHADERGEKPSSDMARWLAGHRYAVERLLQMTDAETLCIELLDYPYGLIEDIVSDYGMSVCLDIGHLLLYGHALEEYLDRYFTQTKVIHLHGVENGYDHRSLNFVPVALLTDLVHRIKDDPHKTRVLTMEIFEEEAFNQSLGIMRRFV